ncbi:hypothetical protein, partial [Streptomyces iakyrus]
MRSKASGLLAQRAAGAHAEREREHPRAARVFACASRSDAVPAPREDNLKDGDALFFGHGLNTVSYKQLT